MSDFEDRIRRDLQVFLGSSAGRRHEDVSSNDLITCPSCGERFQAFEFNGDECIGCSWESAAPQPSHVMRRHMTIAHRKGARLLPVPGWALPQPPEGFTQPVAFYHPCGDVALDWTRNPASDFASEHEFLDGQGVIDWPFAPNATPSVEDWEDIGITPLW